MVDLVLPSACQPLLSHLAPESWNNEAFIAAFIQDKTKAHASNQRTTARMASPPAPGGS